MKTVAGAGLNAIWRRHDRRFETEGFREPGADHHLRP